MTKANEPPTVHKRIFKVMFFTRDDPATKGTIQKGDAIEHDGQLWFVPEWLDSETEAWSVPMRLVSLSAPPAGLHLQKIESGIPGDYLLNFPVPIHAFRGWNPPKIEHEFVVIEKPPLKIARLH